MSRAAIERLWELEAQARLGGGPSRIEQQHAKGKYTARERLEILLDPGTFQELDNFAQGEKDEALGDSVITGWGEVSGRLVYLFAQDFTVLGGSVWGGTRPQDL
jgi:propionyl-CoA carboxylase beta chain